MSGHGAKFLRRSVALSFLLGTLAITWYAFEYYYQMYVIGHCSKPWTNSTAVNNANNNVTDNVTDNATDNATSATISNSALQAFGNSSGDDNNGNSSILESITTFDTNRNTSRIGIGIIGDESYSNTSSSNHTAGGESDGSSSSSSSSPHRSLWERYGCTAAVYTLGTSWWVLTCVMAYLGPLVVAGRRNEWWWWQRLFGGASTMKRDGGSTADRGSAYAPSRVPGGRIGERTGVVPRLRRIAACCVSVEPRRIVLWCLVVAPSLALFVYGTMVRIPREMSWALRATIQADHPRNIVDWSYILSLAMAMPAGTAGMISMGIYVFGTVARHSPLWSAYVVLPADSKKMSNPNTAPETNHGHANLMRDALRLHQWSGILTFVWFALHSFFYLYVYGFEGVQEHLRDNAAAATGTNVTNTTVAETDAMEESPAPGTTDAADTVRIGLVAAWNATIPGPECRPILWHPPETTDGRPHCYGHYRNFNGILAMMACLALVLTSLAVVRRASYRFFYVSHLLLATVFVVTMVFHVKRVIVYLIPSLLCYAATTIPTLVQGVAGALWDGGIRIEDVVVLASSKRNKAGVTTEESNDDGDGVLELTFLAERADVAHGTTSRGGNPLATGILEPSSAAATTVSHRPKSVRICVPSISLLWYPFTVIETTAAAAPPPASVNAALGKISMTAAAASDGEEHRSGGDPSGQSSNSNNNNSLVECKILIGTVGYFTKTLYKRLRDLKVERARLDCENGLGDSDRFVDEGGEVTESGMDGHRLPLFLVDGFYSGASDWIESARNHDVVWIAAGGTGVTPFLTFLPRLLLALEPLHQANHYEASSPPSPVATAVLENGDNSVPSNATATAPAVVSFLWCCRDEALIRHVVNNYLLPLFRNHPEQKPVRLGGNEGGRDGTCGDGVRFRLMIYNTSRDRGDPTPMELAPGACARNRNRIGAHGGAGGLPMRPSKLQHHPLSSRAKALARTAAFLATVLVGARILLWSNEIVHANPYSLSVRGYGLYAVFGWSLLVGILAEVGWRFGFGSATRCNLRKGYALAEQRQCGGDDDDSPRAASDGDDGSRTDESCPSPHPSASRTAPCLDSLVPGFVYSDGEVLEASLSNGRPVLEQHAVEGSDSTIREGPLESALREVAEAESPGVFYCGPEKLLESLRERVRMERRRRRSEDDDDPGDDPPASDCTFYEESFEM